MQVLLHVFWLAAAVLYNLQKLNYFCFDVVLVHFRRLHALRRRIGVRIKKTHIVAKLQETVLDFVIWVVLAAGLLDLLDVGFAARRQINSSLHLVLLLFAND